MEKEDIVYDIAECNLLVELKLGKIILQIFKLIYMISICM